MTARISFLVLSLFCLRAGAYPEMVRHGYPNCISCHVSPAGGGVINSYGRVIAGEVLSTWGSETEGEFLYGAVKAPEWVSFGGDFRALQFHRENEREKLGRFVLMQTDAEAAVSISGLTVVGTVGYRESSTRGNAVISRRHYAMYQPNQSLTLRAGRFLTGYGLMNAEHQTVIRSGLGWDQGAETYNAELNWGGEDADLSLTGQFGSPFDGDNKEKGAALRVAGHFADTYRIGLSYFYGERAGKHRHLAGPFAALGIAPHFFVLAEIDLQKQVEAGTNGASGYLKVDYEVTQGLHLYATGEYSRANWSNELTTQQMHGVGVQFFPRPHFELNLFYQKQQMRAVSSRYDDFLGLMGHVYL